MRGIGGWWAAAGAAWGRRPTLDEIAWGDRLAVQAALRRLAFAVPLAEGDLLCRVLGRHKMVLDERDLSLTPHLALDGYWETPLTRLLLRTLRPGMHAADVGANVGYHTLVMASRVGASGRVTAFEPNPRVAERLRRTVRLNGLEACITVRQEAAGAQDDDDAWTLHFDPAMLGGAYLVADDEPRPGLEAVKVTGRRLDSLPDAAELDLVKIDAEGSEAAVWRGLSGLLSAGRLRTVVLEWEHTVQPDPPAALAEFAAAGFSFGLLNGDGGVGPVTAEALLFTPSGGATMLVLRR